MLYGFKLQRNDSGLPVIQVAADKIRRKLGAPIPFPLPITHISLLRAQDALTGSDRQAPNWFFKAGQVTLDELNVHHGGLITTCLQNIALSALRLRQFDLALAYALVAVRVTPRPPLKALYRAALASAYLNGPPADALYLLKQVRL
jgi:hypothetical protein